MDKAAAAGTCHWHAPPAYAEGINDGLCTNVTEKTYGECLFPLGEILTLSNAHETTTKMHDRYGEKQDPDIEEITDPWQIANCELCDEHGQRGLYVCDHIDYAAIAARGMEKVREALRKENK